MNASKVATATSADWSFFEDDGATKAIDKAARRAAREFEHVEYEDARQDALLWLSVRPVRHAAALASGDYAQLAQDIYSHALREPAIQRSNELAATSYPDALESLNV